MASVQIDILPLTKEDGQRCHVCMVLREKIELKVENAASANTCIVVEDGDEPTQLNFTCGTHLKGVLKGIMEKYGDDDDE